MRIGLMEEATRFMSWLEARCAEISPEGTLHLLYSVDGGPPKSEHILDHLEGYRGSRPVRVGNAAVHQLQLDIYGELMDSIYLYNKYGSPISYDLWRYLSRFLDYVCDHWQEPDEGVWEVRTERRHYVYSKLMCWVALDRGLRLANKRSFPANRDRWLNCRDEIYQDIMGKGWNPKRQAFVQHYGSDTLDASLLIMPLVFFVSPDDPRMLKTLDAILQSPSRGGLTVNSLIYRYDIKSSPDGLEGKEGAFNMCTFWMVEALTRAGRLAPVKLDRARFMFEQMLGYANHLGLYAEQTGEDGRAMGNFPQGFTHLGLISAAYNLNRSLGRD
jgi:GH15 family glucan-1,4-alpha-glucosidase